MITQLYDHNPMLLSDIDLAILRLEAIQKVFEQNQSSANAAGYHNGGEFWAAQALYIRLQVQSLWLERTKCK